MTAMPRRQGGALIPWSLFHQLFFSFRLLFFRFLWFWQNSNGARCQWDSYPGHSFTSFFSFRHLLFRFLWFWQNSIGARCQCDEDRGSDVEQDLAPDRTVVVELHARPDGRAAVRSMLQKLLLWNIKYTSSVSKVSDVFVKEIAKMMPNPCCAKFSLKLFPWKQVHQPLDDFCSKKAQSNQWTRSQKLAQSGHLVHNSTMPFNLNAKKQHRNDKNLKPCTLAIIRTHYLLHGRRTRWPLRHVAGARFYKFWFWNCFRNKTPQRRGAVAISPAWSTRDPGSNPVRVWGF
jgi:hypothetical protein